MTTRSMKSRVFYRVAQSLVALLLVACTHTTPQPIHAVKFEQVANKLPLRVRLSMDQEYRNAKAEMTLGMNTFTVPLGENLVVHTGTMANNVFSSVESDSASSSLPVLKPKVVSVVERIGANAWDEARLTINIEWQVLRPDGSALWTETVQGTGASQYGGGFSSVTREKMTITRVERALNDLFQKSQAAMVSSKILREAR